MVVKVAVPLVQSTTERRNIVGCKFSTWLHATAETQSCHYWWFLSVDSPTALGHACFCPPNSSPRFDKTAWKEVPRMLMGIRQFLWTNPICSSTYKDKNLKLTHKLDTSQEQLFLSCCFTNQHVTQFLKGLLFYKLLLWSENSKTINLFKQHTPLKEGLSRNKTLLK